MNDQCMKSCAKLQKVTALCYNDLITKRGKAILKKHLECLRRKPGFPFMDRRTSVVKPTMVRNLFNGIFEDLSIRTGKLTETIKRFEQTKTDECSRSFELTDGTGLIQGSFDQVCKNYKSQLLAYNDVPFLWSIGAEFLNVEIL